MTFNKKKVTESYLIESSSVICESTSIIISFNYSATPVILFGSLWFIPPFITQRSFSFISKTKAPVLDCSTFPGFFLYTNHIKELLLSITVKLSYSVLVPRHFLGDFFNFHKQFSMLKVLFCLFFAYKKLFSTRFTDKIN